MLNLWYCDILIAMVEKAAAGEFIEDDKLKCYMKCVFDQFRLVSKKGFNFDAMLGLSPPKMKDTAIKAIAACRDTSNYFLNSAKHFCIN